MVRELNWWKEKTKSFRFFDLKYLFIEITLMLSFSIILFFINFTILSNLIFSIFGLTSFIFSITLVFTTFFYSNHVKYILNLTKELLEDNNKDQIKDIINIEEKQIYSIKIQLNILFLIYIFLIITISSSFLSIISGNLTFNAAISFVSLPFNIKSDSVKFLEYTACISFSLAIFNILWLFASIISTIGLNYYYLDEIIKKYKN